MAKEILAVPEQYLGDVIKVIRTGLLFMAQVEQPPDSALVEQLTKWCDEKEAYLRSMRGEDWRKP